MSIGIINLESCTPCGLYLRAVGGVLVGGGDVTNMLAWIAAYNIDTVPWGSLWTGNFLSPSENPTPPTCPSGGCSGGGIGGALTGSQNQLRALDSIYGPPCTVYPSGVPVAYRAQALLPFPTAYYIIAWGIPMDASLSLTCGSPAFWVAQGCIYPKQPDDQYPMVVDLDIPDDTLDASILVQNYYIGLITPGAGWSNMNGPQFAVQQDLAGMTAVNIGMNGFGPNWNPSAVCHASVEPSTSDPFIGP
jgi:hypothetical protein